MAETIKIGGELESTATGNVVASTNHIKDRNKDKYQSDINAEVDTALADRYTKEETYNKEQLNNLITTPDQNYVSVSATSQTTSIADVLPASGASNTIYRIGSWDGSQYRPTVYSEYTWDGNAYIKLNTKEYGIDDEPTAGSDNLVKSGGIHGKLAGFTSFETISGNTVQLKDGQGNNLMPRTKTEVISTDIIHNDEYKGFVAGQYWLPAGLTSVDSHYSAHTDLIEVKQGDVIIVENYRKFTSATGGGPFCAIYPTNEGTGGTRYNCNDVLVPDPSVSLKYTFTVPQDGWIGINFGSQNQSYINACIIIHQHVEEEGLQDLLNEKADKELLDDKVDKEEGKSLIDDEYAEGVHYVDNAEFADLKTDAEDAIIEGIKSNGQKYLPMPSNQDDILQRQIDSINEDIAKFGDKSNIFPMFPQDGSIIFIAHRGVTLGGVANQYECFYQAHRFGFKYIEFDIQPTSDGKFVLAHNYTANLYYTYKDGSAIDDSVRIGDLTLDYILNNFIVKTSNEKMAHAPMDFETSLKLCRRWGLIPYIDIKGDIPSGTVTTKELDYIVNLATKYLGKCNFVCTTNRASWLDYIRTLSEDYALAYYGGDGIAGTNRYTNKSRLTPRTTGVNYYGTAQAKLDAFIAYNEYAKSGNTEMDCDMRGDPMLFNQALDLGCRVFFCYNDPPLFTDNEISSEYGWDKFNYTGQLENDILNLDTSQYISKTVNIGSSYGAICIYLRFKGSININVDGNSKTVTYEDWNEWCFPYMMSKGETGEKTVLITALEPSSIYYLKVCYKNV